MPAITHLLLDIEGTTCPVSFVAEVLFPYARRHLSAYLAEHAEEPVVVALLQEVHTAWRQDPQTEAQALWLSWQGQPGGTGTAAALAAYLELQSRLDRKLTPLKELQGMIWEAGYGDGSLQAPLFSDVPDALQRWQQQGLVLAVYSSGSVPAQQLLYRHSSGGDLTGLFSHWFDTRTGPKQESSSYQCIAEAMAVPCSRVLFISDAPAELQAAAAAGMAVRFSQRPGNPHQQSEGFETITDYGDLRFDHGS